MSLHLKRLAVPRSWNIQRKLAKWAPKPMPGPHPIERAVPLAVVLRDYLHLCDTGPEAKHIVSTRQIKIDGKVAWSPKQGVGFMDVITVATTGQSYRMLLDYHGRLTLVPVDAKGAAWKLCRVENKTLVSGGRIQLNLHDGRNVLVPDHTIKTGDVVKLAIPEQKIVAHYPMKQGAAAFITGGQHTGSIVTVGAVEVTRSPKHNLVSLTQGGTTFSTVKPYVFVVGKDKPEVQVPQEVTA
ncbi:MAG TPA: 30S ribosomal protein S4e [Candidatus Thermoplasmatota archaeon]|nr:30S ribosomal protein S4e [Candidatus Thermoplasmatota archaeon]